MASYERERVASAVYDRLVELGVLHEDERIELIGGDLIVADALDASARGTALALPGASIAVVSFLP